MKVKIRTFDWVLGAIITSLAFGVVILAVELQGTLRTATPPSANAAATETSGSGDDSAEPLEADEEPDAQPDGQLDMPQARPSQNQRFIVAQDLFPYRGLRTENNMSVRFPIVLASAPQRGEPRFIDLTKDRILFPSDIVTPQEQLKEDRFSAPEPPSALPPGLIPGAPSSTPSSSSSSSGSTPTTIPETTTTTIPETTTTTVHSTTTTTIPNPHGSDAGL